MKRLANGLIITLAAYFALVPVAMALDVVKPLKAEEFRVRYAYPFDLLSKVMEATVPCFGPYREQPYTEPISTARSHQLAVQGDLINIMVSDAGHKEFDEGMIPVPIPIDKGLLGYRIALVSRATEQKLATIHNLDDFRSLSVGQGADWGDVAIYKYNDIRTETSQTYDSLFLMLLHGRFDLFPRGATEAAQEFAAFGPRYPQLAIDRYLLIRYPFGQFFYVSKSAPHLAERIKAGLEQMRGDGSFDALFNKYFARSLASLKLDQRVVIELQNPFLPAWVPFQRKDLWFNPGHG